MKDYEVTIIGEGRRNYYILQDWNESNAKLTATTLAEQDFDEIDEIQIKEYKPTKTNSNDNPRI